MCLRTVDPYSQRVAELAARSNGLSAVTRIAAYPLEKSQFPVLCVPIIHPHKSDGCRAHGEC